MSFPDCLDAYDVGSGTGPYWANIAFNNTNVNGLLACNNMSAKQQVFANNVTVAQDVITTGIFTDFIVVNGTTGTTGTTGSSTFNNIVFTNATGTNATITNATIINLSGLTGPSYTLLAKTILGATGASISFVNIPQTFNNLEMVISAITDTNNGGNNYEDIYVQFNGDTGSNYGFAQVTITGSDVGGVIFGSQTVGRFGEAATLVTPGTVSANKIIIPHYTSTTTYKSWSLISSTPNIELS